MHPLISVLMISLFLTLGGAAASQADIPVARQLKILLILPHPDDESMIRATLSRLIERGNAVSEICLTRGEGGTDARKKITPQELAQTRASEMAAAAAAFGFKNLFQMTFPDVPVRDPITHNPTRDPRIFLKSPGPWPLDEIQKQISEIASRIEPDMVITFYPGQKDIHAHHQATAEIVNDLNERHLLGKSVKAIYGFRENVSARSGDLTSRLNVTQNWFLFSPKKISPVTGLSYGEMGSKPELLHQSQMNETTGEFIKNWQQEPDEAFAPMISSNAAARSGDRSDPAKLSMLREALGE